VPLAANNFSWLAVSIRSATYSLYFTYQTTVSLWCNNSSALVSLFI